jgi:dolichol-phosphate mannosyltransferase
MTDTVLGSSSALAIVLPVYNEAESISAVLGEVNEAAVRLRIEGISTSVILVDDDSPDGTADVARAFANRCGLSLQVVVGPRQGLGEAMLCGLSVAASLDPVAVVTLDADGQHNPADIPTLYRAFVARSADIVIGSRWARGGRAPGISFGRAVGSRVGNLAFRAVTGTRGVVDATTSFRVYSRRVIEFLLQTESSRYTGYSFFSTTIALAEAAGYSISEVPIEFRPRFSGMSKLNRKEVWRYFSSLPELRHERRERIVAFTGEEYLATEELQWLDQAKNWNEYVTTETLAGVDTQRVRRIAEVGAGVGAVTQHLLRQFSSAEVFAFEPDPENFRRLSERFSSEPRVQPAASRLTVSSPDTVGGEFDLVVYISVLEHIEKDREELAIARNVLREDGQIAVFVPALGSLYGPIDARSGHHRRYSAEELRERLTDAGFDDVRVDYLDRLGVLPYWWTYRMLNKAGAPSTPAVAFDRVFVPLSRIVDGCVDRSPLRASYGKNLKCTATKRSAE